jgi:two-component system sporulation sensor kinase A
MTKEIKETGEAWGDFVSEMSGDLPVLFDAIGSGFFVVNRDLKILFINSSGREVFQRFIDMQGVDKLLENEALAALKKLVAEVFACGKAQQRREFVFREPDKRIKWVGITVSLYAGRFALAFFRELTEIKFGEQKRNQDVNLRSISYLASGISHEFNNLFAGLMGYYELFREDNSYRDKFLKVIDSVLERGRAITNRLSIFTNRQTDGSPYGDLRACLREVADLFHIELRTREIRLEVSDKCGEEDIYVSLPHAVLEQSLLNLITNAIHAIKQRGLIKIDISSADGFVDLRVYDNGEGLNDGELEVLFTPFFTTKGALGGSKESGSGLGLFYTYSAVRNDGGDIFVESIKGEGTSFTLRLPLLPEERLVEVQNVIRHSSLRSICHSTGS